MDATKGTIGFTAGNFDLLHPGYIYTFEEAKRHCDYFMVFLQIDPSETRFTKYKPVIPLYERYKTLMAIKYVDEVIPNTDGEDSKPAILTINTKFVIIGGLVLWTTTKVWSIIDASRIAKVKKSCIARKSKFKNIF